MGALLAKSKLRRNKNFINARTFNLKDADSREVMNFWYYDTYISLIFGVYSSSCVQYSSLFVSNTAVSLSLAACLFEV